MNNIFQKISSLYYSAPNILFSIAKRIQLLAIVLNSFPRKCLPNKAFELIPMISSPDCEIVYQEQDRHEVQFFPKIYRLTAGGKLFVEAPGGCLFSVKNAAFVMDSDFVRFENGSTSNDKLFRAEYEFARPADNDLVSMEGKQCKLKTYSRMRRFDNVFHISGAYFRHWAHFLVQYYSKLELLSKLPDDRAISILIPDRLDPHIKFMIHNAIRVYKNVDIVEVGRDEELHCKTLFFPKIGTHLGDVGNISTLFHIQVSDATVNYLKFSTRNLLPLLSHRHRKIYIGRERGRGIINEDEIFGIFQAHGFEKIFPHKLGILEKVMIFSEATHIVGPQSSGFLNVIFSHPGTRILMFVNHSRHDDMALTKIAEYNDFEYVHFLGKQIDFTDVNSRFSVNVEALTAYISETGYFDIKGSPLIN